jgi:hypothetical protein
MTEAEWLACTDPEPMLCLYHDWAEWADYRKPRRVGRYGFRVVRIPRGFWPRTHRASERKLRLFVWESCRTIWSEVSEVGRDVVEAMEEWAGAGTDADRPLLVRALGERVTLAAVNDPAASGWYGYCLQLATMEPMAAARWRATAARQANPPAGGETMADILREVFGNPFRPVAFDPAWRTRTASAVAQVIYDGRDFSLLPVLADALEEAGCENGEVLNHCRLPGGHVRGCWVVDLILGKG